MGAIKGVSLEARGRISRYRHPTPVAVLGKSPMDQVIAAYVLRSPTNSHYFTTLDSALLWLDAELLQSEDKIA
jgi:hypothetical protein